MPARMNGQVTSPPTVALQIGAPSIPVSGSVQWTLASLFNCNGGPCTNYTFQVQNTNVATGSIPTLNGVNYFRLSGLTPGYTTGTLTAFNAMGPTTMYFSMTVYYAAPTAAGPLPGNSTQVLTGHTGRVELNTAQGGIFSPNGSGPLTFGIVSQPSNTVALVSINGEGSGSGYVSITPVNPGTTMMSVSATNNGGTATYSFAINVQQSPPIVVHPLPGNATTINTSSPANIELNGDLDPMGIFSKAGAASIAYSITTPPNSSIATALLVPGFFGLYELNVSPVKNGSTPVTVTATNSAGSTSYTLTLTVLKETPPNLVHPIESAPADLMACDGRVLGGGVNPPPLLVSKLNPPRPIELDTHFDPVNGVFGDRDGDTLTFSNATSSNPSVVTVDLIAATPLDTDLHQLKITPLQYSPFPVLASVTVSDGHHTPTVYQFNLVVSDPPTALPPAIAPGGLVTADITNGPMSFTQDLVLHPLFTSPTGSLFTITNASVSSSNPNVASIEAFYNVVSPQTFDDYIQIDAKADGDAVITICGCNELACASQSFKVHVFSGPQPGMVNHVNPSDKDTPDTLYLLPGNDHVVNPLSCPTYAPVSPQSCTVPGNDGQCFFYDPNCQTLTFNIPFADGGSLAPGSPYATAGIPTEFDGSHVKVNLYQPDGNFGPWAMLIHPWNVGTDTVTVEAVNQNNNTFDYTFDVHVGAGSLPAIANPNPISNPLYLSSSPNPTSTQNDKYYTASSIFSNSNASFTYEGSVDDPTVATVTIVPPASGVSPPGPITVAIHPVGFFRTTFGYITATDSNGNRTTYKFTIIVQ